ncbi:PAN domain-containing protein [Methylobacterium currus]|nr:PAN domain-containing protein [Methylobacterium currus]
MKHHHASSPYARLAALAMIDWPSRRRRFRFADWPHPAVLALCLFFMGSFVAHAQELFSPLPANQLQDATPAQQQAIEKLRQRATTQSLDLVRVDINALRNDSLQVSVPNAASFKIDKRNEETRSPGDFTWYGTLSGVPGQATLIVHGDNITGSIQDQGTLYRIEPVGNGVHALIKVDEKRFPPEHPPSFQQKERRGDIQAPTVAQDSPAGDARTRIDILVAYTASARGAVSDINTTIQLAVAEANQSYINSRINIRLNVVDSLELAYSEAGKSFDTILADFASNATIKNRRNTSKADMSIMIVNQSDYCGLADAIMATEATAFAIVHYDCATGYYSFAHELGHLQGARHDPATDSTNTPFAYGHGLQHLSPTPAWRTIMAYACSGGCPRLQYWSNPDVQYNGIAMGSTASNNNARVLNATAATVAAFRNAGYPEENIDRPGLDYRNFSLAQADPGLCLNACDGEAQCKAWTYVRPGVQGPQARCWLKSNVPPAVANSCCTSGAKNMEYSLDRPGLDYRSFDLAQADANLCSNACNGEAQCKAWTYVRPGVQGPKARCWLKNKVPAAMASSCCTSGVKGLEYSTDRPGLDYRNVVLAQADANLCLSACNGEAQCKAWTYVRPGVQGPQARCWLKSNVPAPVASACCTSGH